MTTLWERILTPEAKDKLKSNSPYNNPKNPKKKVWHRWCPICGEWKKFSFNRRWSKRRKCDDCVKIRRWLPNGHPDKLTKELKDARSNK